MHFSAKVKKHTLNFSFAAGTSRGVLHKKDSWFLLLEAGGKTGIGEAAPLEGLSKEDCALEHFWPGVLKRLEAADLPRTPEEALSFAAGAAGSVASIQFAIETALLDWLQGGARCLFDTPFYRGESCLPINGLIWMGERVTMRRRIDEKLAEGFSCLKLKIGALAFNEELELLHYIRSHYPASELMLRVDANGAFLPAEAHEKLQQLAAYDLHSIEQPIRQGQTKAMQALCRQSPIPIALDEELIGIREPAAKENLLDELAPPYIILKPSLLGGMAETAEWIRLAEARQIGWWITSALEANIGLNAIAQFVATYAPTLPQGLGTGQLYTNNIPSPLSVEEGNLCYLPQQPWDLSLLYPAG
jgi:o-succinylbenzoate synthase